MPIISWILAVLVGAGLLLGVTTNAAQTSSESRTDPPLVTVRKPTPAELEQLRQRDERDREQMERRTADRPSN